MGLNSVHAHHLFERLPSVAPRLRRDSSHLCLVEFASELSAQGCGGFARGREGHEVARHEAHLRAVRCGRLQVLERGVCTRRGLDSMMKDFLRVPETEHV